jgi:hypothetical protein
MWPSCCWSRSGVAAHPQPTGEAQTPTLAGDVGVDLGAFVALCGETEPDTGESAIVHGLVRRNVHEEGTPIHPCLDVIVMSLWRHGSLKLCHSGT